MIYKNIKYKLYINIISCNIINIIYYNTYIIVLRKNYSYSKYLICYLIYFSHIVLFKNNLKIFKSTDEKLLLFKII